MTPNELEARTKRFAIAIIQCHRRLPRSQGHVLGNQMLRSGTGVGSNDRAVCRARSDKEFIAKLGTVIEECDETAYWLELFVDTSMLPASIGAPLLDEAEQLTRIFVHIPARLPAGTGGRA